MIEIFLNGQKVRCSVEFKVSGTLTDPTTIGFKYKKPDGTIITSPNYGEASTIIYKTSTGKYYADVICNAVGEWAFRFEGSGACVAVDEGSIYIHTLFS